MTRAKGSAVLAVVVGVLLLSAVIVVPAIVRGQIAPGADGPIDYGTLTTNEEKLAACYSLVQAAIDEHNDEGIRASGNVTKYIDTGKWWRYQTEEFEPRLELLLREQSRLRGLILGGLYDVEEWRKLCSESSFEYIVAILDDCWGDETILRYYDTVATSAVVEELATIDLDEILSYDFVDPEEDFTTYTEVDPETHITVTSSKVEGIGLTEDESAYVYKDFGASHFAGDFEHLLEFYCSDADALSRYHFGTLANAVGGLQELRDAEEDYLTCVWYDNAGESRVYVGEYYDLAETVDHTTLVSEDTLYYAKYKRVEDGGAGDLYLYIYDDAARTSLVDTLSIELSAALDWRYLYAVQSRDEGQTRAIDGYVQDYDLQEAAAAGYSFGYIIGG